MKCALCGELGPRHSFDNPCPEHVNDPPVPPWVEDREVNPPGAAHTHTTIVPGCFRCELNEDEVALYVTDVARDAVAVITNSALFDGSTLSGAQIEWVTRPSGTGPVSKFVLHLTDGRAVLVTLEDRR